MKKKHWEENPQEKIKYSRLNQIHARKGETWWHRINGFYSNSGYKKTHPWARAEKVINKINSTNKGRAYLKNVRDYYIPERGLASALIELEMFAIKKGFI